MIAISGHCLASFEPVRDALAAILRDAYVIGEAVAVRVDGELVICHDPELWDNWKPSPHFYA